MVAVIDLGRMAYRPVWQLQLDIVAALKEGSGSDTLLLVEHEPVITAGRMSRPEHVLVDRQTLDREGVQMLSIERGGGLTYHGPGQLVAYPLLDLRRHRRDVRWFVRSLLEVAARTASAFGIDVVVLPGERTGVWAAADRQALAKVASVGVRIERWISYHGVALNVDLSPDGFEWIVPCGLRDARTSSMARMAGRRIEPGAVRSAFVGAFADVFQVTVVPAPSPLGPAR